MGKIWEFFEEMNEIVYVADVETHELVYMNRKARQQYNIKADSEYKGKLCYEVLQSGTSPCYFCNNTKLSERTFEEWNYENHILRQKFMLKDTLIVDNGRKYRLEMAIDITGKEQEQSLVKGYADNEAMINEGLRISLLTTDPQESIQSLLEYIGKSLKCERIYIFEDTGTTFDNTFEWCAPGVIPQIDNLHDVGYDVAEVWMAEFRRNRNIVIKDIEEIKDSDPLMYDVLKPQDIKSIVVSPLIYHNRIIGFYGVDNPPNRHLDNISTMFMIMGHFIVAQLRRISMYEKMQKLSFNDQLTGLGNRHAVDIFMENIDINKCIGIVFCDVMGLKRVNDKYGHKAGDELIIRCANSLKDVFEDYDIFRMGGDEFLVLCSEIEEDELNRRMEQLRENMQKNDALMAVGSEWRPRSENDIDKLISIADEKMYEDKRQYYNKGLSRT